MGYSANNYKKHYYWLKYMVFSANNELFLYLCDIKANYTRSIYVIPYVKTSTEYVYGTTYTTSIEEEVAKIDEKGIKDMFAAYVA